MGASIYGPDYLRNQDDKQLHAIADTMEYLIKEITRLKSFEYFKSTLEVMGDFQALDANGKEAILLMMDGMLYRQGKIGNAVYQCEKKQELDLK